MSNNWKNDNREGVVGSQPRGKIDKAYSVFLSKAAIRNARTIRQKWEKINDLERELRQFREEDEKVEQAERPFQINELIQITEKLREINNLEEIKKELKELQEKLEETKKRTKYQQEIKEAEERKQEKEHEAKTKKGIPQLEKMRIKHQYMMDKWDALEGLISRSNLNSGKDLLIEV